MSDIFVKYGALSACANPCVGLQTADNAKFLRLWHEVENNKIYYGEEEDTISSRLLKKWFPTTKGGTFRRWYGNMYYVVNWENDGEELKSFKGAVIRNKQLYFKQNGSLLVKLHSVILIENGYLKQRGLYVCHLMKI